MPGAMRISELSRRSGVPVPTIKFYLRERLLPPGTPTARNQAVYGAAHLGRLRLIRVLTGMGQLSIAAAGEVLQALDDPGVPTAELYGVLARARGVRAPAGEEPTTGLGPAQVDALLERRGWQVKPDGPERDLLAHAAALLDGAELDVLAGTAERLVAQQLELLPADTGRATMMARLVTLDAAFDALRRLAVEHHLTSRGQPSAAA